MQPKSRLPPQNVKALNDPKAAKLPPKASSQGQGNQMGIQEPASKAPKQKVAQMQLQEFSNDEEQSHGENEPPLSSTKLSSDSHQLELTNPPDAQDSKANPKPRSTGSGSVQKQQGGSFKRPPVAGAGQSSQPGLSSGNQPPSQGLSNLDYSELHKLFDKLKKLGDTNAKLTVELSHSQQQLEIYAKLLGTLNPDTPSNPEEPKVSQGKNWSLLRDKILKSELLKLRLETHRLRSSMRLNERFGDLLLMHARESDSLLTRCMSLLSEEENGTQSSKRANNMLVEVVSCLMKHNNVVQSSKRDFEILQAELGAGNRREWDGDFGQSEVHNAAKLTTSVSEVLMDHEGCLTDLISRIEASRLDSSEEVCILKEGLQSQVITLLRKSVLVNSFSPDKKSVHDLAKKLRPLHDSPLRSSLLVLEERLRENIQNLSLCTDSQIKQLVINQAKSLHDKAYSDTTIGSLNMVGAMLTYLELQLKIRRQEEIFAQIVQRNEFFLAEVSHSLFAPTSQLLNFLDRNVYNMQSEVYMHLRNTILHNWDKYLAGDSLKPQAYMYLQGLIGETKMLLQKGKEPVPEDQAHVGRSSTLRRHTPAQDWTNPGAQDRDNDMSSHTVNSQNFNH